jgi:ribonuclease P protein component
MKKISTLKRNNDFRRIYRLGKSYVSPLIVTYVFKRNNKKPLRYGITASKKVGVAVKRNRARRVIKEAFFSLNIDKNLPYDLVFVARLKTAYSSSCDIEKALKKQLKLASVIK